MYLHKICNIHCCIWEIDYTYIPHLNLETVDALQISLTWYNCNRNRNILSLMIQTLKSAKNKRKLVTCITHGARYRTSGLVDIIFHILFYQLNKVENQSGLLCTLFNFSLSSLYKASTTVLGSILSKPPRLFFPTAVTVQTNSLPRF